MLSFLTSFLSGALVRWARDAKAATAIEYGLIVGGISFAVMVAIFLMGGSLNDMFVFMANKLASVLGKVAT